MYCWVVLLLTSPVVPNGKEMKLIRICGLNRCVASIIVGNPIRELGVGHAQRAVAQN